MSERLLLLTGLLLNGATASVLGSPHQAGRVETLASQRGVDVGAALLVEYYQDLSKVHENPKAGGSRRLTAIERFKKRTAARYTEGTLQRLLDSAHEEARQAAVLALGLLGTMRSNAAVAAMLRDEDRIVRQLAGDALWALWFRGEDEAVGAELQRVLRLQDTDQLRAGLDRLIAKAPAFAEAYNQRAILWYRLEEYDQSITDCERVLQLNPFHFGAQAGLAQCYQKVGKLKHALRALRRTRGIHPTLDGIDEQIRALEAVLGEEGMKDDKK